MHGSFIIFLFFLPTPPLLCSPLHPLNPTAEQRYLDLTANSLRLIGKDVHRIKSKKISLNSHQQCAFFCFFWRGGGSFHAAAPNASPSAACGAHFPHPSRQAVIYTPCVFLNVVHKRVVFVSNGEWRERGGAVNIPRESFDAALRQHDNHFKRVARPHGVTF